MAFLPRRRRDEYEDQFLVDVIPPEYLPDLPMERPNVLPGPPGGYRPPAIPATPFGSSRPTRSTEYQAARDTANRTTPGRGRSGVMGALRAAGQGGEGGLGGLVGRMVGGLVGGAVNPKGMREQQFHERDLPRLQERWQLEDYDAGMRRQAGIDEMNAQMNQARLANLDAETEYRRSEAAQNRLPRPVAGPTAKWEKGISRRTGRPGFYNVVDPAMAAEWEPYIEEKQYGPEWVETDKGFVNLNAPGVDPRKVRRLQRPRAGASGRREEQDSQRQTSHAAAGVAELEKLAREAMESPEAKRGPIFNQMRAMAANLQAQFGDLVEVGEAQGWPFARLSRREAPASKRPASKADPLGIR